MGKYLLLSTTLFFVYMCANDEENIRGYNIFSIINNFEMFNKSILWLQCLKFQYLTAAARRLDVLPERSDMPIDRLPHSLVIR